jgi:hypothetical protein
MIVDAITEENRAKCQSLAAQYDNDLNRILQTRWRDCRIILQIFCAP